MMEVVTGGSGSGKSLYAEERIRTLYRETDKSDLLYIATMIPRGEEIHKKIERHRKQRKQGGFLTREWYTGLENAARNESRIAGSCVLLECMSNLVANEMYEREGAGKDTVKAVMQGVKYLHRACRHLVIVTNDVFSGMSSGSEETERYMRYLGNINKELAYEADQMTEVIAGVPCRLKTETLNDINEEERRAGMTLITGGACQGKKAYAEKLFPGRMWADGRVCTLEEIHACGAVFCFHEFVRRWIMEGKSKEMLTQEMISSGNDLIIICDEIGCGIVPADAFERGYRETVGRVMTELAAVAERVDRVVCGIGIRIR